MTAFRMTQRVFLFSLAAAACVSIRAAATELKPIATVEGITEYRLDNGLQVLLFPDTSKPTVTVNVTYFVGSRHEGRGETGMAHLLEHMVFKGTPDHPSIWKSLEDHGARFNGTTWVDRTNYFETLPTTDEGNLEWALKMEADRMVNSFIRKEDLDTEMTVVRNEFEMGENNPTSILEERMLSTAYLWHNYGKSTIGSRSDIERVPIENLQAFYRKYYQPDNAMLVVAGNFKPEATLPLIQKYFGAIPRPTRKLDDTYTLEPEQDGARYVELRRNGDVAAAGAAYHICAFSHEDFPALEVIDTILTDKPSGRLYKALVETGMATNVWASTYGWREPGMTVFMARIRQENPVEPVLTRMIEIVEGMKNDPITEDELKRARAQILKNIELLMKDSGRIGVVLSEAAAAGDWRLFFMHRDRIENLKLDDVRRVASFYFKESNRTSGAFYPTKDIDRVTVPQNPEIASLVRDYKGKAALAEGEEWEATPDNIEKRVKRWELSNGMKIAFLSKETRGDAVQAVMAVRYGTEADLKEHLKGKLAVAGMIPEMMMRGTKKYTHQQIRDMQDELKARIMMSSGGGMGGGDNSMAVRINTDREHLAAVIELVGEILRNPTFPSEEFEVYKKEQLAALENQLSDPQALAFNHLFRKVNAYPVDDLRYVPTVSEQIERVKVVEADYLRQFHRDFFGANHTTMTVVGDFDSDEIRKTIEKTFGSWTSPRPFKRLESRFPKDLRASEDSVDTPDKQMAIVACGGRFELRDDDPDYPALHLANYVLGASAKSRLLERLRQKEGLSYGAGSFMNVDSFDRDAFFGAMAICAPENAGRAATSMKDEFEKLIREGIPPEELQSAKKSFALQVQNQLANDQTVAALLNRGLYVGRTMEFQKNIWKNVDELTPEKISSALKKNLNLDRMVRVTAGDTKKMASGTPPSKETKPD
jgi:zinc protease